MTHSYDEGGGGPRAGSQRISGWKMLLVTVTAVMIPILAAVVGSRWPSIGDAVERAVLVATLEAIGLQIYASAKTDH